jgi:D-amino-acid dehydrogenase
VVGGGVIGLTAACELRRRGEDVTLLEQGYAGGGASRGNAGQLCPDLVVPLPSFKTIGQAMRGLWRGDSFFRARANPAGAAFLAKFAWSSRRKQYRFGCQALRSLAEQTTPALTSFLKSGLEVGFRDRPYILVFASERGAVRHLHELRRQGFASMQLPDRIWGSAELTEMEPCLTGSARAGLVVRGQLAVNPSAFVDALRELALRLGVHVVEQARATCVTERRTSIEVQTSRGGFSGERALIAAGAWSGQLLQTLGIHLPIYPGKGYSFSVSFVHPPQHVLMLEDAHIAVLPLEAETRISGAMDLDGDMDRFDARRVTALVSAAQPYLQGVEWKSPRKQWVGPRPLTPTGLPYIGDVDGRRLVYIAAGHNMFGVTLAAATARVVADLICGERPVIDVSPFSPRRRAWMGNEG